MAGNKRRIIQLTKKKRLNVNDVNFSIHQQHSNIEIRLNIHFRKIWDLHLLLAIPFGCVISRFISSCSDKKNCHTKNVILKWLVYACSCLCPRPLSMKFWDSLFYSYYLVLQLGSSSVTEPQYVCELNVLREKLSALAMILYAVLLYCSIIQADEITKTEDELVFVQIVSDFTSLNEFAWLMFISKLKKWQIFRHGERTVRKTYPNDPWKDRSHWPEGFGQLTQVSWFK